MTRSRRDEVDDQCARDPPAPPTPPPPDPDAPAPFGSSPLTRSSGADHEPQLDEPTLPKDETAERGPPVEDVVESRCCSLAGADAVPALPPLNVASRS